MFITAWVIAAQGLTLREYAEKDSNLASILESIIVATSKSFSIHKTNIKYYLPIVQNEILKIFYRHIIQQKVKEISEYYYFSIIIDKSTDVSNTKLLSVAARQYNNKLEYSEI